MKKIIAIDNSELGIYRYQSKLTDQRIKFKLVDVCDKLILEDIIKSNKVEIIFHASAYKHVNILEKNIFSAVKIIFLRLRISVICHQNTLVN